MSEARQLFMEVSLAAQKQSFSEVEALNTFRGPQGPKGDPGSIDNLVINGKESVQVDGKNTINLIPEDVGALPSDGTAVNANALNGKDAEYYATAESVNQLSKQKVDKDSVVNNFTTTEPGFVADARALLLKSQQNNRVRAYTFGPVVVLAISTGTSVTPSTGLIETLPEGLRPPTTIVSLCAYNGGSGNTTGFIHVLPTGEIYLYKMDGYTGASGATYANANIVYMRS